MTPLRAILYGGLTAGALDIVDAFVFFGLRSGAAPMGVLHSIAGGLIGREAARGGGWKTAALGLFLHFVIAALIATVYVTASRYLPVLRRQWLVCGLAFGVIAFFVMTWFVVPMSRVGAGVTFALPATPSLINGLLIHAIGVGLPIAWFTRAISPTAGDEASAAAIA